MYQLYIGEIPEPDLCGVVGQQVVARTLRQAVEQERSTMPISFLVLVVLGKPV